ncbi:hypothetical protein PV328_007387 [Microctonus aethiopoides]|uniref:Ankyrin repeat domain-containing protein 6 n=1 Tax=Microctonus aethiopoides TaxID=144406 RepID=A0AA39C901_9HYME|nr:hypothetical protein PV328_007387 [Microctonus aethiopoides]
MAEKVREACARGETGRLTRLLDDDVKPLPDEHGRSPLLIAAAAGHIQVCEILLRHNVDVNTPDNGGITPLQRAAAEGHLEVVEVLLKHGADIAQQDTVHGNSSLHEAAWRGYSRTVATLAKALGTQRGPLHARNFSGFAPLHLACQNGHNQSCRELLLAGCNPDLQNNYGDTPLHTSARYGHAGVTRILISALCRVSDQNKNGDTSLHIAAAMGRRKLTRILLEAGCDRSLRNKQGETAKDIARRKNLSEILEIINKLRSKSRSRSKNRSNTSANDSPQLKTNIKPSENSGNKLENNMTKISKDNIEKFEKKKRKNSKDISNNKSVHFDKTIMGKQWSPYGCHYYPDPESFPQPKLDSLPADPLARGEQYYLDLAGNIRKGPVGVGYTCYCAPFFRHMEAKLERDKAELKAHIDEAHEKLDLKVTNLERRTRGQINQLTRSVAIERTKCQVRNEHLHDWLSRNDKGRHSERPFRQQNILNNCQPMRAKSLEDLLNDERLHDRSFEIPGEMSCHRGSLDNIDIPAIPRLSKSLKDLPGDNNNRPTAIRIADTPQRLNETFDGVIGRDRTSPLGAAASPTVSLKNKKQIDDCDMTRKNSHELLNNNCTTDINDDWRANNNRQSVHEIIKRFQQSPRMHNGWNGARSISSEVTTSPDHSQSSQNQRIQPQGTSSNGWHAERQDESESSEAEVDAGVTKKMNSSINNNNNNNNSSNSNNNIKSNHQRFIPDAKQYDSIAKLPYRSRSAVYSPTPPLLNDAHNDSGYSTRMYGSSKGASPSLSGQLECDVILPPSRSNYTSGEHLAALLEQPRGHDLTVYERGADNVVINIGTASLV